jgi:hypothetical protein
MCASEPATTAREVREIQNAGGTDTPLVARAAIGCTTCSYSRRSGASPSRLRACEMPLLPATLTASAPHSQRSPSSKQRSTSRVLLPI